MRCSHIFKKITFSSEVLVLSDIRSFRNLTFHNVLARQGSSFCKRSRLNFQAFAFCRIKMAAQEAVEISVKALQTEQSLGYIKLVALASCQLRSQDKVSISIRGNSRAKTF